MAKTIDIESHPPIKNIVRADCFVGGWRIKELDRKRCKVIFYTETDYKIKQFISRQVIGKSGHLASALKKFVELQSKKNKIE